jgi:amino acid adenylation domain-containing protein
VVEQKKFTGSKRYQEIEQYWIDQYKTDVPLLDLPTDFPRPAARTYTGQRLDVALPQETTKALKQLGAKAGCSFVTTLLASFELFIHKLSAQEKIVIGLPAAGQSATGYYGLVGHCVNLLPLRSEVDAEQNFLDFLKKQKAAVLDAYDHQLFTFGSLLQKLALRRDPSRVPLVPVVFNIDMGMDNKVNFYGLKHEKISNPRAFEAFEIFLNVNGKADSLTFEWSYNTQLFQASTIQQWMAEFEYLLQSIISQSTTPIKDLSLTDTQKILGAYERLNATEQAYPKETPLHELISRQARRFPKQVAVRYKSEKLSYQELNEAANQLSRFLQEAGVQPGDTVGLLMDRSPELVAMLLAVMKTGAAYLPIDPTYPGDRVNYMLQDATAQLVVVSEVYKNKFAIEAKKLVAEDAWKRRTSYAKEDSNLSLSSTQCVYLLYTSGSTGRPKGVPVRHYNLVNFLCSMQQSLGLTATDSLLAVTTISFDISCLEVYLPLLSGAAVLLVDTDTAKDGFLLRDAIRQLQPTIMQATPSTWQMLLDAGWMQKHAINTICCGGEPLSKSLAEALLDRCSSLYNLYGPTETTVWSSIKKVSKLDDSITIGQPIANTQIYILNKDSKPVPVNGRGEIYIGGDGVAGGYLNRPDLTNEKFVVNPFTGKGLLYRTGDMGKLLPNGEIQCLGRIDQQVKIRGFRIELEEIEACLQQQPQIGQAVVVAKQRANGHPALIAYVVVNPEMHNHDLMHFVFQCKEALKKELPAYMVPAEIMVLEKLPVTPNGKIDKNALPDLAPDHQKQETISFQPATPQEKIVREVWRAVLGIDNIDRQDDFFDLGGHSLLAVKMMRLIEKETGIQLPLATLYEHSTIEKIAARLTTNREEGDDDCLVPIRPEGIRVPFYFVHGALGNVFGLPLLTKHLHPDQPIFGLRAKDLTGKGKMQDNVEEVAASYVAAILRQNPDGPYILMGYCFGGLVAFEMAKQMQRMGKEVKKLIIIDAEANTAQEPDALFAKKFRNWKKFARRKSHDVSYFLKDPKGKIRYEKLKLSETLVKAKRDLVGPKTDPFYIAAELEKRCIAAGKKYRMTPYNGDVYLLRAGKRIRYTEDRKFLGWQPYVDGEIRIYDVPSIHSEIFAYENSSTTATVLQRCLNDQEPETTTTTTLVAASIHVVPAFT